MDTGRKDTMPAGITNEVVAYGNLLLRESVCPRDSRCSSSSIHIHSWQGIWKAGG